ncbi:MAG: hypothetical protein QOK33_2871, partial [Mycobacterium sp.]|nr:hypothetical protein [Mycobacterium sp.]MDT5399640.1 hypothetical protein [Mycobacterium sp.]
MTTENGTDPIEETEVVEVVETDAAE